jgi:hypothetical protein
MSDIACINLGLGVLYYNEMLHGMTCIMIDVHDRSGVIEAIVIQLLFQLINSL